MLKIEIKKRTNLTLHHPSPIPLSAVLFSLQYVFFIFLLFILISSFLS